ncbi:unnamed protein product, partial [Rotaria magnacalcarata]
MLLYKNYFTGGSSPTSSFVIDNPMLDTTVYDIILLSSPYTQNYIKQQYFSTINWLDARL